MNKEGFKKIFYKVAMHIKVFYMHKKDAFYTVKYLFASNSYVK